MRHCIFSHVVHWVCILSEWKNWVGSKISLITASSKLMQCINNGKIRQKPKKRKKKHPRLPASQFDKTVKNKKIRLMEYIGGKKSPRKSPAKYQLSVLIFLSPFYQNLPSGFLRKNFHPFFFHP